MDNAQFSLKVVSPILPRICMTRLPLKGDLLVLINGPTNECHKETMNLLFVFPTRKKPLFSFRSQRRHRSQHQNQYNCSSGQLPDSPISLGRNRAGVLPKLTCQQSSLFYVTLSSVVNISWCIRRGLHLDTQASFSC